MWHDDTYRLRAPGGQDDLWRAGGRTFANLGDEVVDHAGDDRRCASLQGHSALLVRAIVATGDAKIILRSDNEPAILDLKRQAAAECRVRHAWNDSDHR